MGKDFIRGQAKGVEDNVKVCFVLRSQTSTPNVISLGMSLRIRIRLL
jgi:hypothetical protein